MQGWTDLCYVKADRPGIEPASWKSQVQRPTAKPPRNRKDIRPVKKCATYPKVSLPEQVEEKV